MRLFLVRTLLFGFLVFAGPDTSAAVGQLQLFDTEQAAQQHCPNDEVVWLNLNSGIYHLQGERWYGRTNNGTYVCKGEADQAGDRETRNGQ